VRRRSRSIVRPLEMPQIAERGTVIDRDNRHLGVSQLHYDEPCWLTVELSGRPPEELELNVVRIPKREHRVPCIRWFLDARMGDT